jgi:hypothetical protein
MTDFLQTIMANSFAPISKDRVHVVFGLSVCLSVCLQKLGHISWIVSVHETAFICVFLVTRPFYCDLNFSPHDLELWHLLWIHPCLSETNVLGGFHELRYKICLLSLKFISLINTHDLINTLHGREDNVFISWMHFVCSFGVHCHQANVYFAKYR